VQRKREIKRERDRVIQVEREQREGEREHREGERVREGEYEE
jgi:hypothetical protein